MKLKNLDRNQGIITIIKSCNAIVYTTHGDFFIHRSDLHYALNGDLVSIKKIDDRHRPNTAKVTEILKRNQIDWVGTLKRQYNKYIFIPQNKRFPYTVFIDTDKKYSPEQKVLIRIIDWHYFNGSLKGKVVKTLGKTGVHETEIIAMIKEFGFDTAFPQAIIQKAKAIKTNYDKQTIEDRKNYRGIPTFTIDPETAKDYDDALSVDFQSDGRVKVGIHIADVSHFVKPNDIIDIEAQKRAVSVYLVDRCLPMLPERLSNDICSLKANEDRLCFSIELIFNALGEILDYKIFKSIIHSQKRYNYQEVKEIIRGKKIEDSEQLLHKRALLYLHKLAEKLRAERFKNGALNFETDEIQIKLNELSQPIAIEIKERHDAHFLVEEFMLMANKKVTEFFNQNSKKDFVYRIHDKPNMENLQDLASLAKKWGYKINFNHGNKVKKELNRLMDQLKTKKEHSFLTNFSIKTMAKAIYSIDNIGHYGLGFSHYTHFTSPIRRYSDILVHRLLSSLIAKTPILQANHLAALCMHCSVQEKSAMSLERLSIRYKQIEYLKLQNKKEHLGVIMGFWQKGIFVELKDSKCSGFINFKDLRGDYFNLLEKKHCIIGRRTGKTYFIGQSIKVTIKKINMLEKIVELACDS